MPNSFIRSLHSKDLIAESVDTGQLLQLVLLLEHNRVVRKVPGVSDAEGRDSLGSLACARPGEPPGLLMSVQPR